MKQSSERASERVSKQGTRVQLQGLPGGQGLAQLTPVDLAVCIAPNRWCGEGKSLKHTGAATQAHETLTHVRLTGVQVRPNSLHNQRNLWQAQEGFPEEVSPELD